jgi:hypothetical protein
MLADCVARELPNEMQSAEISLWSGKRRITKHISGKGGGLFFK